MTNLEPVQHGERDTIVPTMSRTRGCALQRTGSILYYRFNTTILGNSL
jgi:hypothetical protein